MGVQTKARPMTAADYAKMPDPGYPTELIRGEVVESSRPKPLHGKVCFKLCRLLDEYLDDHDIGHGVGNDAGFLLEENPDTVRGPDVAFYSYDRLPADADLTEYPTVAPELAFEVLSESDTWTEVMEKVDRMLEAGVQVVLLLDPPSRAVTLVTADGPHRTLTAADSLELPDVLPGWKVPVARLFPKPA